MDILLEAYGGSELDRSKPAHRRLLDALAPIQAVAVALATLPAPLDEECTGSGALRTLLLELRAEAVPPEPGRNAVELLDWLELPLDDAPVVIDFEAAEMVVAEPLLDLQKEFAVVNADALDRLTVTVTATNNGTATAYNPRFLDDLSGTAFSFVGDVAGASPPDNIDTTTYGADSPLFSWAAGFAIAAGEQISFSFVLEVADTVEPLEVLDNTIQADWTSLPGQSTALNTAGTIGVVTKYSRLISE